MSKLRKLSKALHYLYKKIGAELNVLNLSDHDHELVLYRCTECGYWSKSLGFLHGHMEKHTPIYSIADIETFRELTEKIVVTEYDTEIIESFAEENM